MNPSLPGAPPQPPRAAANQGLTPHAAADQGLPPHAVVEPGLPPPVPGDHWRRFRRLMLLMTIAAVATAAIAIWQMRASGAPLRLHFLLALGGGIVITLLLAGALMGLAFVSSRSGHDESINLHDD